MLIAFAFIYWLRYLYFAIAALPCHAYLPSFVDIGMAFIFEADIFSPLDSFYFHTCFIFAIAHCLIAAHYYFDFFDVYFMPSMSV